MEADLRSQLVTNDDWSDISTYKKYFFWVNVLIGKDFRIPGFTNFSMVKEPVSVSLSFKKNKVVYISTGLIANYSLDPQKNISLQ